MLNIVKNAPVNGLDLGALGDVVEAIQKDPGQAIVGFDVTTRWAGQTRSESTVTGFTIGGKRVARSHRIVADEPRELLGTDDAPNPQELLMAALNACMMVGYVAGASLKGIALESVEIETRGSLDLQGFLGLRDDIPPGYESIDYEVRIKSDGPPADLEDVHQSVMRTSPNYFNINRPIALNGKLTVG